MRKESLLEASRSKVTKESMDKWFDNYKAFLSDRDLLDKGHRIWNIDETGFTMGSKAGKVIGPTRSTAPQDCPHVSGGSTKDRLTVLYSANAEGDMMPPFFVYPEPKPTSYDPLIGAQRGSEIIYTKKGWMNTEAFNAFLDHFHKYAGNERPVVLLMDSVSSHINMDIFTKALSLEIEIYRLIPNATHLIQPLDKGVFGSLKKQWYATVRKNTRDTPDKPIGKRNFAAKLAETHLEFYKPKIIVGSFKGAGIFPVNRNAVSDKSLKPSLTFMNPEHEHMETDKSQCEERDDDVGSRLAFEAYNAAISTPVREKYEKRLSEGYDVEGISPGFDVYKKLKSKTKQNSASERKTDCDKNVRGKNALDILADVALQNQDSNDDIEMSDANNNGVSPVLQDLVKLPKIQKPQKNKPVKLASTLPDNLTSSETIRKMALSRLKFAKQKAEKEKRAKFQYLAKLEKNKTCKKPLKTRKTIKKSMMGSRRKDETLCFVCLGSFEEEEANSINVIWIQCDKCSAWLHKDCIPLNYNFDEDVFLPENNEEFVCHLCS